MWNFAFGALLELAILFDPQLGGVGNVRTHGGVAPKEFAEVALAEGEQLAVVQGDDIGRADAAGEDREFAKKVAGADPGFVTLNHDFDFAR